jgi:hypothetical protein
MGLSILVNDAYYLDLQKEFVGLSYQIADIGSIDKRQGTFSNDFTIPNTSHNRTALGYSPVQNVYDSDLKPNLKIPAKAFQNNILISNGFIQIIESTLTTIDISFYGDTVDVFESIRGKKLNEIDLRELRHAYTAPVITNSFSNTSGYIYLVLDYGLFTNRSSMQIKEREIFPAIFIDDVVKGIFRDAGYKVTGTLLNRALYKKSIVPFCNSEFGFSQDFVDSKNFFVTNGTPTPTIATGVTTIYNFNLTVDDFSGKTYGNELFNLLTDRYTADDDYQITVRFSYSVRQFLILNGNVSRPILVIKKNGVTIATGTSGAAFVDATTTLTSGDYLEAYVTNNHSGAITLPAGFVGEVSKEIVTGSIVFPETVLPELSQEDFIKWLVFRFAAVLDVDTFTKTVYLDQFNDLKNNSVDDWSNKVDLSKEAKTDYGSTVKNYAKRNIAKYTLDEEDFLGIAYNATNGIPYGSSEFELDNDFVEDKKDLFETAFAGTFNHESFSTNQLLIPYIPRHLLDDGAQTFTTGETSDNGGFVQFALSKVPNFKVGDYFQISSASVSAYNGVWQITSKVNDTTFVSNITYSATSSGTLRFFDSQVNIPVPRVLTVYGNVSLTQISNASSLNILGTSVTEIPFAYFYKSTYGFDVDDFKESLAFGAQNIFAPNDLGAFETDYLELIRILNNPEMKKAYLKLNQIDITNLEFLQRKYIERFGGYFYLNLIDEFDGSGDSVLCELIKL